MKNNDSAQSSRVYSYTSLPRLTSQERKFRLSIGRFIASYISDATSAPVSLAESWLDYAQRDAAAGRLKWRTIMIKVLTSERCHNVVVPHTLWISKDMYGNPAVHVPKPVEGEYAWDDENHPAYLSNNSGRMGILLTYIYDEEKICELCSTAIEYFN